MKKTKIRISHSIEKKCIWHNPNEYIIYKGDEKIGVINFKIMKKVLIIGYLEIYSSFRNKHYGYEVIDYLLSHYKIKCIIGQSLKSSRSFWNKSIQKFNGQRRNFYTLNNCTSSFIIPKYKILDSDLEKFLEIGHDIEF